MDSTTQWSISWTLALLPPQEMIPPESLFHTRSYDSTTSTNSEQFFGLAPCISSFYTENSTIPCPKEDITNIQDIDSINVAYEDFQSVLAVEEQALSL